jgi:hypothetical protein
MMLLYWASDTVMGLTKLFQHYKIVKIKKRFFMCPSSFEEELDSNRRQGRRGILTSDDRTFGSAKVPICRLRVQRTVSLAVRPKASPLAIQPLDLYPLRAKHPQVLNRQTLAFFWKIIYCAFLLIRGDASHTCQI